MELRETPPAILEAPATGIAKSSGALPLENGDRLHAREFLRRYEGLPRIRKAELVEGVVYMGSPVSLSHAEPDNLIQVWLGTYAAHTPGTRAAGNATVFLDADNVPQPDALLRLIPEAGGRSRPADWNEKPYLHGPPELIVEIAATSASIDLHTKLRAYCRNGVSEYLVWRALEDRLEWYHLDNEDYVPLAPDASGIHRSRIFPGLWCCFDAMTRLDGAAVLATLHQGLASPEHASFVQRLASISH